MPTEEREVSLPLRSDHFTTPRNPRLEGCLVSDAQHVPPGSTGEHVRLIQIALAKALPTFLVADGKYGPNTAAAVLRYKSERAIVRVGQLIPDNIVGKQTIKALDDDMVEQEAEAKLPSRFIETTEKGRHHDHSRCPQAPSLRFEIAGHKGTPINPQGTARFNIGGEGETHYLDFEDCVTDERNLYGPAGRRKTQTIPSHTVTDLCLRSSPITTEMIDGGQGELEISRIAKPGCRFTYANNPERYPGQMGYLSSIGMIIEDLHIPGNGDSGLRVVVILMRGDGWFVPRVPVNGNAGWRHYSAAGLG